MIQIRVAAKRKEEEDDEVNQKKLCKTKHIVL